MSSDPGVLHIGGNSGYQSINLAVLVGAARVVLLGYDMRHAGGKVHWHGSHPEGMNNPKEKQLAGWAEAFSTMLPDLQRLGVEVINCTPGSALKCFPMARLEDTI